MSVVISNTITSMLLTREFFTELTSKSIIDATTSTGVQLALSAKSKDEATVLRSYRQWRMGWRTCTVQVPLGEVSMTGPLSGMKRAC